MHNPDIPLRPNSTNSPCHPLASFLLGIITPMSGNTKSAITNTNHVIDQIKNIKAEEEGILASFDIASPFTSVPTEPTLTIVKNRICAYTTLQERTNLSVGPIIELREHHVLPGR